MKNFISVNDAADINALVKKALAYKEKPLSICYSGKTRGSACCFSTQE